MRGIVVAAERSTPTNRELISAFRAAGVVGRRLGGPQLRTARMLGRLAGVVLLGRVDVSRRLDGVGDSFWELRRLEQEGWPVLNPSRALLRCHDKLQTALRLHRFGLPHPRTALLRDPDVTPSFAGPWVIKPRFGSWGRDVERCGTEAELRDALRRLSRRGWFRRQGAIVQEYVPNDGAGHLRAGRRPARTRAGGRPLSPARTDPRPRASLGTARNSCTALAWNTLAGAATLAVSVVTRSFSLEGCRLSAVIDMAASVVIVWRFRRERPIPPAPICSSDGPREDSVAQRSRSLFIWTSRRFTRCTPGRG